MRKLLMIIMATVTLAVTSPAFAAPPTTAHAPTQVKGQHILNLPLFERAILIIKAFETLHTPRHWPTICFGHVVQKGERFTRRQYSEREAEALLRKDYARLCNLYKEYGADMYLLGALAYNIGPGAVNKSSVLRMLKAGNRDIIKIYTSYCHYKGKPHKGLYNRRLAELAALYTP